MKDDQERFLYATLGVVFATLVLIMESLAAFAIFAARLFCSFAASAVFAVKLFRSYRRLN
jgi:hypothetical protein